LQVTPTGILTLNGGSSSIRFAIYVDGESPLVKGKLDRIGSAQATLTLERKDASETRRFAASSHGTGVDRLLEWLGEQPEFASIGAVGHRVVHGMKHSEPERVTAKLLTELERITPYDPDHLPVEIGLIKGVRRHWPKLTQVACFDTAFHRTMPPVARRIPIPRRYEKRGVERYGFHGLSYSYLIEELTRLDPHAAKGRVVLAHLGSGASLAAVHKKKSADTSMGFTPNSGLMMGTRAGDIDSGLEYFLGRTENMTAAAFQQMVNHESGLLGVSGTSSDVRDLCERARHDSRAAEALELFCYDVRKSIGAFAAALGGLDTVVFSAGIGENSPRIRERVCEELDFLGMRLSRPRNKRNAAVISTESSRVKIRVIRTDEELMIARSVRRILRQQG
jgi:acetate kinase